MPINITIYTIQPPGRQASAMQRARTGTKQSKAGNPATNARWAPINKARPSNQYNEPTGTTGQSHNNVPGQARNIGNPRKPAYTIR